MATKALPSPEVLRQLLRYEPDTGRLFWLPRPDSSPQWNAKYAHKEALTSSHNGGYRHGSILWVSCLAHRVIMAMETGAWPANDVDHINGDRTDNRRANLRLATRSENLRNTGVKASSRSGIKGVTFHTARNKWVAQIRAGGENHRLGYFKCRTAAMVTYVKANRALHGEFGRIA